MWRAMLVTAATGLVGAGVLCPLCGERGGRAGAQQGPAAYADDSAVVRLHVSGMTCGSCPVTARRALKRLPGVLDARVTLEDSLAVVTYDPRKVTPEQIAAHLTKLTGYGARVLPGSPEPGRPGAQAVRAGDASFPGGHNLSD